MIKASGTRTDGWYYDVIERPDGSRMPVSARSIVGVLPVMAAVAIRSNVINELPELAERSRAFVERFTADPETRGGVDLAAFRAVGPTGRRLISVVNRQRMERVLARVFDPAEFLSAHGIRSVSRYHTEHPLHFNYQGFYAGLDYEPAESTIPMFGGNSNWRGPIWFPINHLLVLALYRIDQYFSDSLLLEYPTGSGRRLRLADIADDLSRRLVAIFLDDEHGRRPVFGATKLFQDDPAWHDLVPFYEYFHGDNGAGLGASHQTGWTGLVADLIASRRMARVAGRARPGNPDGAAARHAAGLVAASGPWSMPVRMCASACRPGLPASRASGRQTRGALALAAEPAAA